jgi:hypothetical protein
MQERAKIRDDVFVMFATAITRDACASGIRLPRMIE